MCFESTTCTMTLFFVHVDLRNFITFHLFNCKAKVTCKFDVVMICILPQANKGLFICALWSPAGKGL